MDGDDNLTDALRRFKESIQTFSSKPVIDSRKSAKSSFSGSNVDWAVLDEVHDFPDRFELDSLPMHKFKDVKELFADWSDGTSNTSGTSGVKPYGLETASKGDLIKEIKNLKARLLSAEMFANNTERALGDALNDLEATQEALTASEKNLENSKLAIEQLSKKLADQTEIADGLRKTIEAIDLDLLPIEF